MCIRDRTATETSGTANNGGATAVETPTTGESVGTTATETGNSDVAATATETSGTANNGGVTAVETSTSNAAGAGAGQLANTGGAPLAAETILGALLAALGAALLKPRDILRRFIR